MFDNSGAYLLNDQPNLTLIFEMDFRAGFSNVLLMYSKVTVRNNAGTLLNETFDQGVQYNSYQEAINNGSKHIFYTTAPLRHILNQGDRIFVNTKYSFLTPNSASIAGTTMRGKFSMHAN